MKIQFKLYLYLLLLILCCCMNNAHGQLSFFKFERLDLKDHKTNHKEFDSFTKSGKRNNGNNTFGFGINLEGLSGSLFFQNKFRNINPDLGIRIGAGFNSTSFIVLAGSRFSTKYSLRYEKRDADNGDFFYEFIWIDFYLEKERKKFNYQYGLRFSKFGHTNDRYSGWIGGDFFGFYFQPTIGKGVIRIGSRIQWGVLSDKTKKKSFQKELAIIASPIVLILKFGQRK